MKPSVIISYIRSEDTLPKLVRLLRHQTHPCEIVLVNGDDYRPRITQGKGQMIGLEKATGDVIFLIDSDRWPPLNWIERHLKHYPEYDLVAGHVMNHTLTSIEAMSFGNVSMKREVLEKVPINDMIAQQDCDFCFRFIKSGFRGTVDGTRVVEPPWRHPTLMHQFLTARNVMYLRKKYRVWPPMNDFLRLKSPVGFYGGIIGLLSKDIVRVHD